jgi:hypothetical protein
MPRNDNYPHSYPDGSRWALIYHPGFRLSDGAKLRPNVRHFGDESDAIKAKRDFQKAHPHGVATVVRSAIQPSSSSPVIQERGGKRWALCYCSISRQA